MLVVLVHRGDVVETLLTVLEHALHAVLNNDSKLIRVSRIITNAVRDCCSHHMTVPVLVLKTFAVKRCATRCCTNQEAFRLRVTRRPCQVANTLKSKHRVIDVKRHHRVVGYTVRRRGCEPSRECARLVNTLFKNLTCFCFLVIENLPCIVRRVALTHRRIDAELSEHALHTERTGLIGHNRHYALANFLVLHQRRQDTDEGHCGRYFTLTARLQLACISCSPRHRKRISLGAAGRQLATELCAALAHIAHLGTILGGSIKRHILQVFIANGHPKAISESL